MLAVNFLVLFFGAYCAAWTVDLPEVRRHNFEKNEKQITEELKFDGKKIFSNVEANSQLNTEVYSNEKYADDYEYQSYSKKSIDGIVHSGSVYLEGLRRSIDKFIENLQKCTAIEETAKDKPEMQQELLVRACEQINRASGHVRQMAELAMATTKELQDHVYEEEYDDKTRELEENELVLKLAWFLDQLARLTGYEPDAKDFVKDLKVAETPTVTPTVTPPTLVPGISDDVKLKFMNCLKNVEGSLEPATVRCNFIPPTTPANAPMTDVSPTNAAPASPDPKLLSLMGALPEDNSKPIENKRRKRSEPSAAENLMRYYVKHKVWVNSNPDPEDGLFNPRLTNFEVGNEHPGTEAKIKVKRSAIKPHYPEHHGHHEVYFHHEKKPIHHIKEHLVDKLKLHLHKIHIHHDKVAHKLDKLVKKVHKRSAPYYKKKYARVPENPEQDISFYVKNKKGTIRNDNAVQAAEVRGGLERIFQTGNIETIRRFGSNYNPANPAPLLAGAYASAIDV